MSIMNTKILSLSDKTKLAKEYALLNGYDTIRNAGMYEHYHYFHYYNKDEQHLKLGLPHYIAIDNNGDIRKVVDIIEINLAMEQEVRLNNLA